MARILNVISAVSPAGGTPTKLRALMKASHHEHYLYHPGYKNNRTVIEREIPFYSTIGVKAYYGIYGRNIIAHANAINKIIRNNKIEIIHFYFNFEQLFAFLIKKKNPNVVFVRSIVGYEEPLSFWREILMKMAFNVVDNYIYISHYIKDLYETTYPILKKKHTQIIYNGAVNIKDSTVTLDQKNTVVSTSGLCKRKNVNVLIEAFRIIKNDYGRNDIRLIVIGEGENRSVIESKINEYGISDIVTLVGITDKVADYLDKCAIYVHPAITEGFGIAVAEAMQMSCACIVADKGALPEIVVDGLNGYVINAYDADLWAQKIIFLNDHPSIRKKFAVESRGRAEERFSLQSFIDSHDEYYDNLIDPQVYE